MPTFSSPVATHAQSPFPKVFTLVTGPRRSLSLNLSNTRVYEPHIRARLGTTNLLVHKQLQRPMLTFSSPVATHAQSPFPKVKSL